MFSVSEGLEADVSEGLEADVSEGLEADYAFDTGIVNDLNKESALDLLLDSVLYSVSI